MSKLYFLIVTCILLPAVTFGQTSQHTGWLTIFYNQKLSEKWRIVSDVQLRGGDQLNSINSLLVRGGLSFKLFDAHTAGAGVAYIHVNEDAGDNTNEFRLFEQYQFAPKILRVEGNMRVRLEQRFVRRKTTNFSQRARLLTAAKIPLYNGADFERGPFAALQNELFLNVLHNERVNGEVFDQNRSLVSLGFRFRFSKIIDLEAGYLFIYQKRLSSDLRNNIVQVLLTANL